MQNDKNSAAQGAGGGSSIARYGRILVCVLTAGFVFPNVFVENMAPASAVVDVDDDRKDRS